MFRFDRLAEADLGALLRLVGEVSELPSDKTVRRTHVLTSLLNLLGGRSAAALEFALPDEGPFARPGTIININTSCEVERRGSELYLVHNMPADPALHDFLMARGKTITMMREVEDREFYRSAHYDIVRRPFDIDHTLYCRLTLPDGTDMAVGVQRCPGDPLFGERERALVHFLHTHAPHIYYARTQTGLPIDQLAPRLRPVMRYLLQGDSEKEVARKLKLSPHTVHQYVKTIYREFDVNSRAELLAEFVQ